jgi:alanine dehydrogenase
MLVGVPKEIKVHEYRVGLVPAGIRELLTHGHSVVVESNAGTGIGLSDRDYEAAGAEIVDTAEEVFTRAEMIVKVKEPQEVERRRLREGQVLFTYLHLAPDPDQTRELVESGATCIAYETVTASNGGLPLLAPMSEVAGRMSIQAGAQCLEKERGGRGVLLGGVPGVEPGRVTILGGGVVGRNAALMAVGLGADVTVIDRNVDVLRHLVDDFGTRLKTAFSTEHVIEDHVEKADLVIGGVLIPGAAAPKLVTENMVRSMPAGSVIVDVSIDQGGCIETSKPTTHAEPTFIVHDVVHYCVANMPGAVARTSTFALTNATLPYVVDLAEKGYRQALGDDPHLRDGLNIHRGEVTCEGVAEALNYPYVDPIRALAA